MIRLDDHENVTACLRETCWGHVIASEETKFAEKFGGGATVGPRQTTR